MGPIFKGRADCVTFKYGIESQNSADLNRNLIIHFQNKDSPHVFAEGGAD